MGWQVFGHLPDRPKFIIAVAPHSSNFDFVLTVGIILSCGLKTSFLAKSSLFRFPLGMIIRGFGGIPVDRSSPQGVVGQMTDLFNSSSQLVLGIAPEGTRSAVKRWRSGFALIAKAANIPVQPAIVDYAQKHITFTPLIEQVDDADATVSAVQAAAAHGSAKLGG